MFSYVWPIALIVVSNTVYQICSKSIPHDMDPFASLTVTYGIGAIASLILYFALNTNANLLTEYTHINWAPFALGIVIVGLEVGFIYAYKAGWAVSAASVVQSSFLAIALILVGFLLYKEIINASKIIGILICMVGLYFINK